MGRPSQIWTKVIDFDRQYLCQKKTILTNGLRNFVQQCEVLHKYAEFLGLHVLWEEYLSSTIGIAFKCHAL
jgi:hypothetical protein